MAKVKRVAAAGVGLVAAGVVGVTQASPAGATAGDCWGTVHPGQSGEFDGLFHTVVSTDQPVIGIQANITVRRTAMCNGASGFDDGRTYAAWVMLADPNGNGYAQSGFVETRNDDIGGGTPAGVTYHFAQSSAGGAPTTEFFDCGGCDPEAHDGSTYKYNVAYDANSDKYAMRAGVNTIAFTPQTKTQMGWAGLLNTQWFGETKDMGQGMPGSFAARTTFSSMNVKYAAGWTNNLPSLQADNTDYRQGAYLDPTPPTNKADVNSCTSNPCFDIWSE